MPPEQALVYVMKKALFSFQWLAELDNEWEKRRSDKKDGSKIREQQAIILDAFCVYISSLFDKTKDTHSLLRSYVPNNFIKKFESNTFVKLCIKHRNNRAGHQSKKYGSVAPLDAVINSHLDQWLQQAQYLVGTRKMTKK